MTAFGDDFASATLLNDYQLINGLIDNGGGGTNVEDYFRFVVSSTDNFSLISGRKESMNMHVRLYDSTETEIYSNFRTGQNFADNFPRNLAAGTYYIFIDPSSALNFSEYSFTFILVQDGVYPPVPNTMYEFDVESKTDFTVLHDNIVPDVSNTHIRYNDALPPYDQIISADITPINIGFKIPPKFFEPKIIMVGNRIGAHVPLKIPSDKERYIIKGTVQENGVVLSNKTVRLYHRDSGVLLGETITNVLGEYKFGNPLWETAEYYVIAFDDLQNPILQAVIHDALVPFKEVD